MTTDIYQALNEVMKQVGYVQKERSQGMNYSYAGEAALIAAIRPHLVDHGIAVHPHEIKQMVTDTYTTRNGAIMNRTMVVVAFRFAHAPSGTSFDVTVTGEGADIGDKSANKAMTGAYKYALRQSLMIETGDDPDKFPSDPPNGKTEVNQEPAPTVETNGDKPLMAPAKLVDYIVNNLGYKNDSHVRATMGLLGFKTVPQDRGKREQMYKALADYHNLREEGMSQDDALAAMDGEKE